MTTWTINRHEIREAARLISLYRSRIPGPPWDRPGIENALTTAAPRADIADLTRAALRAAANPTNRTPAVIALDGDHWRGQDTTAPRPVNVPSYDRCSVCMEPLAGHPTRDHEPRRNVRSDDVDPRVVVETIRRTLKPQPRTEDA